MLRIPIKIDDDCHFLPLVPLPPELYRSILIKVVLLPNENCRVKTFQRSITLLVFDENDSDLAQVVDRFCIKHFHFDTVAVE